MKSQLQQRKKTSAKLKLSKAPSTVSALLNLSEDEKKQVAAWLDLERNAPILQKTDKAIAAKLNVKTADLTLGSGTGLNVPSGGGRLKSAAQVLLSDGDMTDAEIEHLEGARSRKVKHNDVGELPPREERATWLNAMGAKLGSLCQ